MDEIVRTMVLLHGGYHGAWCWQPLIEELRIRGARGVAFDLPGHGDDATPRREVGRETYVAAACAFISNLPQRRFTLVGHSLAGIVLPDIAARFPDRIEEVVYLAALVLNPGERAIDLIPESRRSWYLQIAKSSDDHTLWISFDQARDLFFEEFDDAEAQRLYRKLTPQPFQVYLDPAAASLGFPCPVRYIVCGRDLTLPPHSCLSWAAKLAAQVEPIDSGHDVMLSRPAVLAEVLLK